MARALILLIRGLEGVGVGGSQGISLHCSRSQEIPTHTTLQDMLCTCSTTESHTTLARHTTCRMEHDSYGHTDGDPSWSVHLSIPQSSRVSLRQWGTATPGHHASPCNSLFILGASSWHVLCIKPKAATVG